MSISLFFRAVRRYWFAVLACAAVGVFAAVLATHLATKKYSSQSEVLVSVSSGRSATDVAQGSDYALHQMTTYTGIVTSASVLQPVIEQLGLKTTVSDLSARVSVSNPIDTLLIDIAVSDTNPDRASQIANAVARQFSTVLRQESPAPAGSKVVSATTITPATVSSTPASPSPKLNLAVGTVGGLVAGALVAQLMLAAGRRRSYSAEVDAPPQRTKA